MSKSSSSEQLKWNADEQPDVSSDVSGRLSHSWPSGPRTVILHRCDRGFGFTLRHFIVYPDEPPPKNVGLDVASSANTSGIADHDRLPLEPMDTIFVKHVKEGSPAQQAGLNTGDRVVSVNGETIVGKSYSHVVQLIQRSGNLLQLLVVPKEDDILQLYFPGRAYRSSPECKHTFPDVNNPSEIGILKTSGDNDEMLLAANSVGRQETRADRHDPIMTGMSQRRFSELMPSYRAEPASVTPTSSDWSLSGIGHGNRHLRDQLINVAHQPAMSTSVQSPIITNTTASDLITRPIPYSTSSPVCYYVGGKRYDPPGRPPWACMASYETALRPQPPANEYYVSRQPRGPNSTASPKYSESRECTSLQGTPPLSLSSLSSREHSIEHPDLIPESIISRLRATFEKKEEFLLRPTGGTSVSLSSGPSLSVAADNTVYPLMHPTMPTSSNSNNNYNSSQKLTHNLSWPPPMESMNGCKDTNEEPTLLRHPKPFVSNLTRIQENIPTSESSTLSLSSSRNNAGIASALQIRRLGDGVLNNSSPRTAAPLLGTRQLLLLRGEQPLLRKTCSLDSEPLPSSTSSFNNQADNSDDSLTSMDTTTWDDMNGDSTSAVHLVSRRARQFEHGALEREANLRMNLYKNELARMTTRGQTPKVSDRAAQFESLSTSQETIGSESDHCPSPRQKIVLKKDVLSMSGLTRQNDPAMKIDKITASLEDIDDAQRHKAKRQNSYLTAVNTPFQDGIEKGFVDDDVIGRRQSRRPMLPNSLELTGATSEETVSAPVSPHGISWNHLDYNGLYRPALGSLELLCNGGPSMGDRYDDCMLPTHLITKSSCLNSMPITGGSSGPGFTGSQSTLLPPSSTSGVVLRRKTVFEEEDEGEDDSEDGRTMRRVSYLKATSGESISKKTNGVDSSVVGQNQQSELNGKGSTVGSRSQSIQKLKAFFGERTPHIVEASERRPLREFTDNSQTSPGDFKEGLLHCKMAAVDGKRATDRSWKQTWVVLKDSSLYLYKDKKDSTGQALAILDEQHSIDLKNCRADIATDYTKKKHVFRLSTLTGSEYLLQADSNAEMQRWIRVIQDNLEGKSGETEQGMVLRKSALFEREIGERLSPPQPGPKGIRKLTNFRNRSPTGHSPTSKTRKSNQGDDTSPKSKTWRGKMVKTIRKIHGTSPTSATQPEGLTIGVPLEFCPPSSVNEFVPFLLELCTGIVEARGLEVVGIYRVPGNTTAVSYLMDAVNHGFDGLNLQDPKWNDVNVISSLLKAFFRKLPEPLVTAELYPFFIEASKWEDPVRRVYALKKVLQELPDHNYETLKFLIEHLRRIVAHSNVNKMEARNLAIVFGPTLVRAADDNMVTMVTDMSYQCRIVEMLLNHGDWFFNGDENDDAVYENLPYINGRKSDPNSKQISNQSLLLNNVQKIGHSHGDICKTREVSAKDLVSTIIGAANRKVRQKIKKHHSTVSTNSSEDNERDIDREIELRLRMLKPKYVATRTSTDADQKSTNRTDRRHSEDSSTTTSSSIIQPLSSDDFSGVRKMSMDSLDAGQLPERIFCVVRQPSKKSTWSGDSLDTLSENQPNDIESDSSNLISSEKSDYDSSNILTKSNMQERIRRFELETKALLQRNLHHRHKRDEAQRELDRQRIESEWRRAKKEMEQEDYLDRLVDNPRIAKKISDFTQKIESLNTSPKSTDSSKSDLSSMPTSTLINPLRPITDGTISYRRAKPLAERTLATARSARTLQQQPEIGDGFVNRQSHVGASRDPKAFKRVASVENFSGEYIGVRRGPPMVQVRQRPLSMVKPRPRLNPNGADNECGSGGQFVDGRGNDIDKRDCQASQLKSRFCGSLDSLREFYETTKEYEDVPRRPPRRLPPAPLPRPDDVHVQRNENTRIVATLSPTMHTVSTTSSTSVITATIVSGSSMPSADITCSPQSHQVLVATTNSGHPERMESEVVPLAIQNNNNKSTENPSPNPRRKSSHLRNLKRRHTVGGTKDFEKFRLLVGSSMTDGAERVVGCETTDATSTGNYESGGFGWSAWERLRPAVSEDGFTVAPLTHGRSMRSWLQKERIRTSTPDLLNLQSSSAAVTEVKCGREMTCPTTVQNKSTLESQV